METLIGIMVPFIIFAVIRALLHSARIRAQADREKPTGR